MIQQQLAAQHAGESTDHERLKKAEADLRREDTLFGHTRDRTTGPRYAPPTEGTALHQLALRTLIDLYGSPLAPSPSEKEHYLTRLSNYISEPEFKTIRNRSAHGLVAGTLTPGDTTRQ